MELSSVLSPSPWQPVTSHGSLITQLTVCYFCCKSRGRVAQQIVNYTQFWLQENSSNYFVGVFREWKVGVRVPNTFWTLLLIAAAE